jgi:hypothetical protein
MGLKLEERHKLDGWGNVGCNLFSNRGPDVFRSKWTEYKAWIWTSDAQEQLGALVRK